MIDEDTYHRYEKNQAKIPHSFAAQIATYYGIDVAMFGLAEPTRNQVPKRFLSLFRLENEEQKHRLIRRGNQQFKGLFSRLKQPIDPPLKALLFEPENIDPTKPVLFFKFFIGSLLIFIMGLILQEVILINLSLSFSLPFSLYIYLHEIHRPKNLKALVLFALFLVGGTISLTMVTLIRTLIGYPEMIFVQDILTGVIEESAKFLTAFVLLRFFHIRDVLSGVLLGFGIGLGFDIFETISYGWNAWLELGQWDMIGQLSIRSLYAVLGIGHHFWTGLLCGVMVLVNPTTKMSPQIFRSHLFWMTFILVILIHSLWNFTSGIGFGLEWIVLVISLSSFIRFYQVQSIKIQDNLELDEPKENVPDGESIPSTEPIV